MLKLENMGFAKAKEFRSCLKVREKPIFENLLVQTSIFLDKRFSFLLEPEEIVQAKVLKQIRKKRKFLAGEWDDDSDSEDLFIATSELYAGEMDQFSVYMKILAQESSSLKSTQSANIAKDPSVLEAELSAFSFGYLASLPTMKLWIGNRK